MHNRSLLVGRLNTLPDSTPVVNFGAHDQAQPLKALQWEFNSLRRGV